jgi:hypothetical protein
MKLPQILHLFRPDLAHPQKHIIAKFTNQGMSAKRIFANFLTSDRKLPK